MKILEEAAITFQLIFTKYDKIKPIDFDEIKKSLVKYSFDQNKLLLGI